MEDDLHAVAILALPLVSLIFVVGSWRQRPTGGQVLAGLLLGIVGYGVVVLGFARGASPPVQWAVPAGCGVLCTALIADLRIAWKVALALALWTVALPLHWQSITGKQPYADSPRVAERQDERLRKRTESFAALLRAAGKAEKERDPSSYPAGPLGSSALLAKHPDLAREKGLARGDRWVVEPLWHTGFTSLWSKRSAGVVLWYPGGTPGDLAARLEWKEAK